MTDTYLQELAETMERHLDLDALLEMMPLITRGRGRRQSRRPSPWPGCAWEWPGTRLFAFIIRKILTICGGSGPNWCRFRRCMTPVCPTDLDGLYLGGGYPEVFARELSANMTMLHNISKMAAAGLPIYGGMRRLDVSEPGPDQSDRRQSTEMAGVLPLEVRMLPRLKVPGLSPGNPEGRLPAWARPAARAGGMNFIIRK